MKEILRWINDALADNKMTIAMTYYRVKNREIAATDGKITAGHPCPFEGNFVVPGVEFEKVLMRMQDEPKITVDDGVIKIRCGRFSGTVQTLPLYDWAYPGIDDVIWKPLPEKFLDIMTALKPFISDNPVQTWAQSIALENNWMFATNNVAIAGAECPDLGNIQAMLPLWAIEFLMRRQDGLTHWTWTENYVAFKWESGAWMRSNLIIGKFDERAAEMVKVASEEIPAQLIDDETREAYVRICSMAEDTVLVYSDCIRSRFGKAVVEEAVQNNVHKGKTALIWGARFLLPIMKIADAWTPVKGLDDQGRPKPAVFHGKLISGYITGRVA